MIKFHNIQNKINRFVRIRKYEKEQQFINKYVQIKQLDIPYDEYQKIDTAKKTLANYAKHNNVKIKILNGSDNFVESEIDSPTIIKQENTLRNDCLKLEVQDLKTKTVLSSYFLKNSDENTLKLIYRILGNIVKNLKGQN